MVSRDRAVVLGASMGGLLAARVLSEAYAEVVLVDRDRVRGVRTARRGVPHGRHAHGLVGLGQRILEEEFPGLRDQLRAAGVPTGDFNGDIRWYFGGIPMAPSASDVVSVAAPRPVLEHHVRERAIGRAGVRVLERYDIEDLRWTADHGRVVGARVRSRDGGEPLDLDADLVVDCTGRASRTPRWLTEHGYTAPAEERVKIGLAYTTREYVLPRDPFGDLLAIIPVATPWSPRGGLFFPAPGEGRATLSLTGVLGDHAPTDDAGFTAFAHSLPVPEIGDALRDAEPLGDATRFSYPSSVWRHYERLAAFPRGLLVLGDAVCSFNPVYGQGMSVAAAESSALRRALEAGTEQERPRDYLRAVGALVTAPWHTSAGADLAYSGVPGHRPLATRLANAYVSRLQRCSGSDPSLGAAFARVAGLVAAPPSLMRPSLAWRVLRSTPAAVPTAAPSAPTPSTTTTRAAA